MLFSLTGNGFYLVGAGYDEKQASPPCFTVLRFESAVLNEEKIF
jgi:hypothetical protein